MLTARKKTMQESAPDKVFLFFIYLLMILILLIILVPLLYVVSASFSDPQAVISGEMKLLPVRPTLRGYEAVFRYHKIILGFRNSFFYMVAGTLINLVMTMLAAYPLSRPEFKARRVLSFFFMFAMIFSGGLVPTFMVVEKLGLINTVWAMLIPNALSIWNLMLCRNYIMNNIPNELYEAGVLEGCTPFRFFTTIVIPLSKPILAVLALYYGIGHWNTYFSALIYLKDPNLQPLQIALREILVINKVDPTLVVNAKALADMQGLTDLLKYAVIVVSSLPLMLIYPFVQKYFVKGIMVGSVKG